MKFAIRILGLAVLVIAEFVHAQVPPTALSIGENTKVNAGGLVSFGYAGDYGDGIPSEHGLNFGLNGTVNGFYYSPRFISFTASPYYNQSRADSDSQSISGASGVTGSANFFTGSNFPGSVSYNYDRNSTGTFGLAGQPNFTTIGSGQGFGVNWSALLPDWPTLSLGYSQGSGHGTLYGTDQETDSSNRSFNARSNYQIVGFRLMGSYSHNNFSSEFPQFLENGENTTEQSSASNFGIGAEHALPLRGTFSIAYNRASSSSDYLQGQGSGSNSSATSYTDQVETASANFNPTPRLGFNVSQNYTGDLTGYLAQNLGNGGVVPPGLNLGSGAHSSTVGGGLSYLFTNNLTGSTQATYYDQSYFGQSYSGAYLSGTLSCNKRLFNILAFSATVIDSSNGQGENAVGFASNVNFFRRFGLWSTEGQFSYSQNVQTVLVTYTTSGYSYGASIGRHLSEHTQWAATFSGSHSALTNEPGSGNHSESYSTSLVAMRKISINAFFTQSSGISLLGNGGLIQPQPTPGLTNFILFNGSNYGGSVAVTPVRRLSISGAFSRAISETVASTASRNNTEVFNGQMQYHLRKIALQAGYLRFTQGISAIGAPVNTTSFYVGATRWFDFF